MRLPNWASPAAYLKLYITMDGLLGPWAKLYDRVTQEVIGEPTPQVVPSFPDRDPNFVAYDGPLDPDDLEGKW